MRTYPGLLDGVRFPERLTGHVVEPVADPRVHGYAVQADLGRHVGFLDVGWLALTGELPTADERDALSLALTWLSPLHIGEAPTHAAVLARVAGAPDEALSAIATVALGQTIAAECRALAPFFAWLDEPPGRAPPAAAIEPEPTSEQAQALAALAVDSARWFGAARALPATPVLRRTAAAYALLHRLGIRDPLRLHALATWARLPAVLAEAACMPVGAVMRYPAKLPDYRYVEGDP